MDIDGTSRSKTSRLSNIHKKAPEEVDTSTDVKTVIINVGTDITI